jgi:glycosyltransferase involved in cell wall biosynthesis
MKIALVHDYIKEYGGAERVLETLHDMFPDAPVYTSVFLPAYLGPHRDRFKDWDIHTSWLQYLPFKQKLISPWRIIAPIAFKRFDFSEYDIIITSATGAYFPNILNKKKAKLICYCHTPPRYLYGYATAREWKKYKLIRILGEAANHILRIVDFTASKNVDQYIANSEEVKRRIEKFYRREAVVIYPPIEIAKGIGLRVKRKSEYYVAGGRLARPKHVDLIIKACKELKVPLKVFGKAFAGYGEELEKLAKSQESHKGTIHSVGSQRAKSSIELLGEVTDEEKWELLSGAKAYLFASEDEDFGILPVEAMAVGIPVIAYRSGGVQETVVEGKTGLFFDELTVESLKKAIKDFEKKKFDEKVIRKRAEEFSEDTFKKKMRKLIQS